MTKTEAWEASILFMLRGLEETARWTTAKIEAIRALQTHTASYVRHAAPKIYSHELPDVLDQLGESLLGQMGLSTIGFTILDKAFKGSTVSLP